MTRAAWTWMTCCQHRGDCDPGPAGLQSLRCHSLAAKLFCQARVLETGTRCELGDRVTLPCMLVCHVKSYLQRWRCLGLLWLGAVMLAEAGDIMTQAPGDNGQATVIISSSGKQLVCLQTPEWSGL